MLIQGIDDEPDPNQNPHYQLDQSTVFRAGHSTAGSMDSQADPSRPSVMLPTPSGKEKKPGYFSTALKSLKQLNAYITQSKKPKNTPQERSQAKQEDIPFEDFNAQLKQIKREKTPDKAVFKIDDDEDCDTI